MKTTYTCRFCKSPLNKTFVDLGLSPIANAMIPQNQPDQPEMFYSLHTYICESCLLVQLPNTIQRDVIFNDEYTYFSSFSDSWLAHAKKYVEMMKERFSFTKESLVIELASNDGYLLQYFKENNIPVLGVDPSANVAEVAIKKGIPTEICFFGVETANKLKNKGKMADLIIANNVLAHVPDLNDFVEGIHLVLKPTGIATIEFPHLMNLIMHNEFDTIYHEHYSYYSLLTVQKVFAAHKLTIFDVEELSTHGGSLRLFVKQTENNTIAVQNSVNNLIAKEKKAGLDKVETYAAYEKQVKKVKQDLLQFVIETKKSGKSIVGYGAPAKGNTLLNYCGIRTDFIDYTVDRSPHKQNHLLPGTRIPVYAPEQIRTTKPDYILILPWNLKEEITQQLSFIREWNGQFVAAIPELKVW